MSLERKTRLFSIPEFKAIEPKTIERLKTDGYVILDLHGWNQEYLRINGFKYNQEFEPQSHSYKLENSFNGQIALYPDALYILNSDHRSLNQQEEKVLELDRKLSQKYPGLKVEMGNVTDWLSIVYLYQATNAGKELLSKDRRIRTQSSPNVDKTAIIGTMQDPLNPNQWKMSVTQSPYFMPNPSIYAAYFLRAA